MSYSIHFASEVYQRTIPKIICWIENVEHCQDEGILD